MDPAGDRTLKRTSITPLALAIVAAACSCRDAGEPAELVFVDDGPLVAKATIAVASEPWVVRLADVNDDDRLDLVVGCGAVDILLGDGGGGFARVAGSPFEGPKMCGDFAFGDFDEDGLTDVVVAEHDRPRFFLFRGNGAGTFEHAAGSPFAVDAEPHLHTIAARDFDEDGHLDLVTDSWPQSRLVLVKGRGDGTFDTPGTQFAVPEAPILNLAAGDMNGDGHADVVTPAHDSESVTVLLGDGRGGFEQAGGSPFASFGGFSKVALADLDGDGHVDVAEVHRADSSTQYKQDALSILINDGTGRLAHGRGSPFTTLSGRAEAVAVGDSDGDGRPDVVTISATTCVVTTFRGGAAGFESAGGNTADGSPTDVALGDIDGDGRAEVLVTDRKGHRILVLEEPPRETPTAR